MAEQESSQQVCYICGRQPLVLEWLDPHGIAGCIECGAAYQCHRHEDAERREWVPGEGYRMVSGQRCVPIPPEPYIDEARIAIRRQFWLETGLGISSAEGHAAYATWQDTSHEHTWEPLGFLPADCGGWTPTDVCRGCGRRRQPYHTADAYRTLGEGR